MKGPYERLKYDLRRLWECPACKRRERTAGTVTFWHCACQAAQGGEPTAMKLVEDGVQRVLPAVIITHELPPHRPAIEALPETVNEPPAAVEPQPLAEESPTDSSASA